MRWWIIIAMALSVWLAVVTALHGWPDFVPALALLLVLLYGYFFHKED